MANATLGGAFFCGMSRDNAAWSEDASLTKLDGQPKAIYAWISNTDRSSYFSLNIDGHTFYRLNYPLRLNKWYHTCQSWNGKTGEWQIWVNAERVGRGFHNRLVGHVIPSGGIAITGQAQSQLGGGFQEGYEAPKGTAVFSPFEPNNRGFSAGSGGMLGEITMVQLYNVALTAGKAHKDHKHHHAHQYDHNGNMITTPAPTTTVRSPLPAHPLLTGGQLNNRGTRINFATGQQPQLIQGQEYNVGYANGQLIGGVVTQQLTKGAQFAQFLQPQPQQVFSQQPLLPQGAGSFGTQAVGFASNQNPANVQFVGAYGGHALFKRHNQAQQAEEADLDSPKFGDKLSKKVDSLKEKKHSKRGLFVAGGTLYDDGLLGGPAAGSPTYQQSLQYGLAGIGNNAPILKLQKESDEREPAEAEVKAVMNICTGCDPEPFDKALVFGWRTVAKKLFSGAFYTPAVPQCKVF
ncbi:hypothetical protein D910_10093 [Dendroctonus ponderosae]|uniref:Pentraxin (PTX) domain-containing protein n=1 Tax=Dendroctonus ponderosae TaxID=77166 RepID=U4URS9_DENPD|nr:hypothetical protein D910_10093 [Dendroctonus ponderosae]